MSSLIEPLRRGALYRFLALSFMPPSAARVSGLKELAGELAEPYREEAIALAAEADTDLIEGMYHALIGAQKNCRCCESDYLREAAGNKGVVLGDIAGFYQAFGFAAGEELREVPDHISIELSFLSFLALKESYARHRENPDQAALCRDAELKFLNEHLDRWFFLFSGSLAATARDGFYCSLAVFADSVLGPLLADARERLPKTHSRADECQGAGDVEELAADCLGCFVANQRE